MKIATVKEIKDNGYRVGLVPCGVKPLTAAGHDVFVESGSGVGSGISNDDYQAAGAIILSTADEVFAKAEMIVKVKEPVAQEVAKLREGQILFTYLHLAPMKELTESLLSRGVIGIANDASREERF